MTDVNFFAYQNLFVPATPSALCAYQNYYYTDPKPELEPDSKSQNTSASPIADKRQRKFRDVLCVLIFMLTLAAGGFGVYYFKLFSKTALARSSVILRPADSQRRVCGMADQPDPLAVDYSRMLAKSQFSRFCTLWKVVYTSYITANGDSVDCATAMQTIESQREFFALTRKYGRNRAAQMVGVTGTDGVVCLGADVIAYLTSGEDYCEFPAATDYVCGDDFIAFAKAAGVHSSPPRYYSEAQFYALGLATEEYFIAKFCVKIMHIKETGIAYYKPNSALKTMGVVQCSPDPAQFEKTTSLSNLGGQLLSLTQELSVSIVFSLKRYWRYLLYGSLAGIGILIVYLVLLQFLIKILVYGIISLAALLFCGLTAYFAYQCIKLTEDAQTTQDVFGFEDYSLLRTANFYMALSIIFGIIALVVLIFIIICCKRIRMGIAILSVSITCLRRIWYVFFLPVVFVPIFVIHIAWVGFSAYQFYVGGMYDARDKMFGFSNYVLDKNQVYALQTDYVRTAEFFGYIFLLVWGVFAIFDMLQYMICYCGANWYFSDKKHLKGVVGRGIGNLFKNFGTCLSTGFITGLVWLIRFIINYVVRRMKYAEVISYGSKVIRGAVAVGQCCLKCLEKIVKWINRNILVYASITGTGYCKSMTGAMKLLMGSFLVSSSVKVLSIIFLESSKLIIAVASAVITLFMIYRLEDGSLELVPSVAVGIIVYCVSFYVIGIVSITADTILMCFLYEETELSAERSHSGRCYAPDELLEFLS